MPEGDTLFRAAATLDRALRGQTVTRFATVFPSLARVDVDRPLRGRAIEGVESRGKHLLMRFSGDLILRTHMRMNGTWHIYRPAERWQSPKRDMRILIATAPFEAVAFRVPIAEFHTAASLAREPAIQSLGPDLLSETFSPDAAVERMRTAGDLPIAEALLNQRLVAGIGNVFKSEVLFAARVFPFTPVAALDDDTLRQIVDIAQRQLRLNTTSGPLASSGRQTTGRLRPDERLYVYGRAGEPCYRCGAAIVLARDGADVRLTYYCPGCQGPSG